jgi:hypothetical protein
VREEEEAMLLPLVRSLYDEEIQGQHAVIIIAPRHMHRVEAWENGLRAAGLPVQRVSCRTKHAGLHQSTPTLSPSVQSVSCRTKHAGGEQCPARTPQTHDPLETEYSAGGEQCSSRTPQDGARCRSGPAARRSDRQADNGQEDTGRADTGDTGQKDTGRTDIRPILLLDVFGELHAAYRAVDAAFVGGSLAPLGGQNFLEAAGAGIPTLVGPFLDNFLWVGEDVFDAGLVRRVKDAGELREALPAVLTEQTAKLYGPDGTGSVAEARTAAAAERRARFRALIAPKLGGALRSAHFVLEYLQT